MIGIIKRDLTIMFSSKQEILFMIFYVPFLILIIEFYEPKWLYFALLVFYTYILSITSFSYDVSGKSKYVLNSLPINAKEIVFYKYLSIFVYFAITIVYIGVYLWIINALKIKTVDYFNLEMMAKALPVIMISTSIVFPAYFRFEPKIAQIVHMIVFMSIFIGLTNLDSVGANSLVYNMRFLQGAKGLLLVIGLYILSLILSMKFYQNRDL